MKENVLDRESDIRSRKNKLEREKKNYKRHNFREKILGEY